MNRLSRNRDPETTHTQKESLVKCYRFLQRVVGAATCLAALCGVLLCDGAQANDQTASPIVIGLNADMSTADAVAGRAIQAGALVAIDEINALGGVLGRPLALRVLDHRRNPARGVVNVQEFAGQQDVVAILGGKHTPVILAELEAIHAHGIPYLIPWAAGTILVDNNRQPNFIYRVSVRDEFAGPFMVAHAYGHGYRKFSLLLEQTAWGRSNEMSLLLSLRATGLAPVSVEWFNWGERFFTDALARIGKAGADVLIFVGNAPDGLAFMRAVLQVPREERLPIVSHWGIVGGELVQMIGPNLAEVDLVFLQTFSFFKPPFPDRADRVFRGYQKIFPEAKEVADIIAPAGVAHAYDLVHLLAKAVEKAGSIDRAAVRDALENIEYYDGLMRNYAPPFTPFRHDALDRTDFCMAKFVDGNIKPLRLPGSGR
jgi:branched-chain amino acid transport system substrate-binding protein